MVSLRPKAVYPIPSSHHPPWDVRAAAHVPVGRLALRCPPIPPHPTHRQRLARAQSMDVTWWGPLDPHLSRPETGPPGDPARRIVTVSPITCIGQAWPQQVKNPPIPPPAHTLCYIRIV